MDNSTRNTPGSKLPKLGSPANRALGAAGYYWLEQFTEVTEEDFIKLHGVGPKAIRILNEFLEAKGMNFKKQTIMARIYDEQF